MPPALSSAIGVVLRQIITGLCSWMVAHQWLSKDEAAGLNVTAIVGWLVPIIASLVWGLYTRWHAKAKVAAALNLPQGSSEAAADRVVARDGILSTMKQLAIVGLLVPALLFSGCTGFTPGTTSTTPAHSGSGVKVGGDLVKLYAQAIQDYADYKAGNVNIAWTIANVAAAYKSITQTADDAKQLVQDATGKTAGAETLAARIHFIFGNSGASGPDNAAAIAAAAQAVADNRGP